MKGFTSSQIVATGVVTRRQLQWWDKHEIIIARRRSPVRNYSADELALIFALRELHSKGFGKVALNRQVRTIRAFVEDFDSGFLVFGNGTFRYCNDAESAFMICRSMTSAVILLDFGAIRRKVALMDEGARRAVAA